MGNLCLNPLEKNRLFRSKMVTMSDFDYYIRAGKAYHADDSTANIGGEAAPADTIELTFTTPAAGTGIYATFNAFCSTAAAVFTLREGFTAGGTGGGALSLVNLNRNSTNTSSLTSPLITNTVITSGGTVLHQETLTAGIVTNNGLDDNHPWVLKHSTKYGISVYLAAAGVARVSMHWIEI